MNCVLWTKLLPLYRFKLKTMNYWPKIDKFYRIVSQYRAIAFTVSENGTEKPNDMVNKIDTRRILSVLKLICRIILTEPQLIDYYISIETLRAIYRYPQEFALN